MTHIQLIERIFFSMKVLSSHHHVDDHKIPFEAEKTNIVRYF